MLTATQLHLSNALLCFAIGTPANLGLLWLIRHRTGPELRLYSYILAQTALLDVALLLINVLFQPLFLSRGADSMTGAVGLALLDPSLSIANRCWNFSLFLLWLFTTSTMLFSVPVQFYYRYSLMCRCVWH